MSSERATLALAWAGPSVAVRGSEAMTGLWLAAVGTFIALDLVQSGVEDPGLVHPAVQGDDLGAERAALGWFTLALFVLLVMPWPMAA